MQPDPRKPIHLEATPEVERLTVRAPAAAAPLMRPGVARPLSEIPLTPRLMVAIAYVSAFASKGWSQDRSDVTMRALGFKPEDIAEARAVWKARNA